MQQQRIGVFETNSSSTHSVSISDSTDYDSVSLERDGTLLLQTGEFGWDKETFSDINSRLKYAVTHALSGQDFIDERGLNLSNLKEQVNKLFDNSKLELLFSVLKEQTGAKKILIKIKNNWHPFGYIDHQSEQEADKIFESEKTLKQFIFSKNSYFETDNDNG